MESEGSVRGIMEATTRVDRYSLTLLLAWLLIYSLAYLLMYVARIGVASQTRPPHYQDGSGATYEWEYSPIGRFR